MPTNTYTPGTYTLDLGADAYNISISVRGARGGRGGTDAGAQGGSGGTTTRQSFNVNQNYQARRFTLYVADDGGNGVNSAPNASGGGGGSGLRTGGRGGNAGDPPFSGGGGGGGGASGVAIDGVLVICMGGSGGGGGASNNRGGGNGGANSGLASNASSVTPTNGGGGGDPGGTDGGGGGGGGAGDNGAGGGGGGTDNSGGGGGGGAGGSTYRSDYVTAGSANTGQTSSEGTLTISWENAPPPTVDLSLNKASIINNGETAQLSWSVSGLVDSITLTDVNNPAASGTVNVSPPNSKTYTLRAVGPGGTTTEQVTLTVYQPVQTTISASPNPIVRGSQSTLSWTVSGDASSASINQGIGGVLFVSSTNVSPTSTTTYTLSASGNGGSDSDSVTVRVYQPVELSVVFPGTYDYGINRQMSVTTRYASSQVKVDLTYLYFGGTTDTETINLTPNASSESGAATTQTFTPTINWNNFGPENIDILVTATGLGGTVTRLQTETVNIDRLPDNINIPDQLEQAPSTDPVVSPDDDTVLSDPIFIEDIDIPVEIKASRPIQVRFDDDDPDIESNWKALRQIN